MGEAFLIRSVTTVLIKMGVAASVAEICIPTASDAGYFCAAGLAAVNLM